MPKSFGFIDRIGAELKALKEWVITWKMWIMYMQFLKPYGLVRVETKWTPFLWGDAFYVKTPQTI